MKCIITESKLEETINNYFYELFSVDNIHSINQVDDDGNDDETRVLFYIGDYGDDNICFYWYDCGYFYAESDAVARNLCPIVSVEYVFEHQLNGYFGNMWKEPFKKWFIKNFNLPVKTVD